MLQKKIDEMSHDELYEKVEDHKGDEVLSAISLRLVQENREMRAALKVYLDRDKQLRDTIGRDPVSFLQPCKFQSKGSPTICRDPKNFRHSGPCSKRCETPTKGDSE